MTPFIRGVVEATVASFMFPGPVVEVGAYQVAGQAELIDLRRLFPGRRYIGLDMRPGPGVDQVENVERMTIESGRIGSVLALSTLEHVKRFWLGVEELKRILRPEGVLLLSCPFYFHIHNHPSDYWRFTPEALDTLLEDRFPQRILGQHGPVKRPGNVWAVAFGPGYPPITLQQMAAYDQALRKLARSPSEPSRTLRYRLARLFCGRGPFSPHLDRDRFSIELRTGLRPAPAEARIRARPRRQAAQEFEHLRIDGQR
jgi:SAM-dependent methyltransferase